MTIQFLSGGLFLVGGIAGFVMMYRQTGAAWCTFCERINCIPELGFDCTGIGGVNVTATTAAP